MPRQEADLRARIEGLKAGGLSVMSLTLQYKVTGHGVGRRFSLVDRPIMCTRGAYVLSNEWVNAHAQSWTGQPGVNRPIDLSFQSLRSIFL